jgi:hypothetical protein
MINHPSLLNELKTNIYQVQLFDFMFNLRVNIWTNSKLVRVNFHDDIETR